MAVNWAALIACNDQRHRSSGCERLADKSDSGRKAERRSAVSVGAENYLIENHAK